MNETKNRDPNDLFVYIHERYNPCFVCEMRSLRIERSNLAGAKQFIEKKFFSNKILPVPKQWRNNIPSM